MCEFYGVAIRKVGRYKAAILFKAVNEDFSTRRGVVYAPNTKPEAPDWDGGVNECGGGLHFSPRPFLALRFKPEAPRFVACPVRLSEIVVHKDPMYPDKVKAPRVCAPCWEVDIDGEPVKEDTNGNPVPAG